MDFIQLAQNRYSVREYSSELVSQELLDKVCEVSMKTPSVCNRQATPVYQITDLEKIKAALEIQGGFSGYDMSPVLLLVTSNIRAFMNNGERNEPFVDGGLFSMSLLYALEAYGLAACPLNAMFSLSQDRKTRALLHIPDYELPVMYIAVGNFPDPYQYAAQRDEIRKPSSRKSDTIERFQCVSGWSDLGNQTTHFCLFRNQLYLMSSSHFRSGRMRAMTNTANSENSRMDTVLSDATRSRCMLSGMKARKTCAMIGCTM